MARGKKTLDTNHRAKGSDSDRLSKEVILQVLRGMQAYAMLGLVLGVLIALGGIALIALGFTGSVDITFQSGSSNGHIATGSLGIVVTIVGAAIVRFTKPHGEVTPTRIVRRMRRR